MLGVVIAPPCLRRSNCLPAVSRGQALARMLASVQGLPPSQGPAPCCLWPPLSCY